MLQHPLRRRACAARYRGARRVRRVAAGRGAFLDARKAIAHLRASAFPASTAICRGAGIDPARDLIPVAPAAHYHMGGVATDANGPHLARRPVGGRRSRLDRRARRQSPCVEFAARSRGLCGAHRRGHRRPAPCDAAARTARAPRGARRRVVTDAAREQAPARSHVGACRRRPRPATAWRTRWRNRRHRARLRAQLPQLRNMATAALLITAAACSRSESRGGHFRSDYPNTDPQQATAHLHHAGRSARAIAAARARASRASAPHDLPALPRRLPLAARDRRGGDARARRRSRPRRRRHLDRDGAGGHARRAPSSSRARPARSPDCRWSRRRLRKLDPAIRSRRIMRDGAAVAAKTDADDDRRRCARHAGGGAHGAEFPRPPLRHRHRAAAVRHADRAHARRASAARGKPRRACAPCKNTRCAAAAASTIASGSMTRS